MKLIDTHNHLYLEDFDPEQDQLVTAAKKSGIDTLLLPNVDTTTIGRMHDLCDRYPDFTYPMMNDVMRIVKDMNPRILDQTFDNTCSIKLSIRKSEAEQLRSRLKKLSFE